jgi:hypothetical protein
VAELLAELVQGLGLITSTTKEGKKFLKYTERQYLGINKTNRRGVSMLWAKI